MVPKLHPQWEALDFAALFASDAAFVNTDSQNSILSSEGVLTHEKIWEGAREQGGSFNNIMRLATECRVSAMPFMWLRYDRFIGDKEPTTVMDAVQYRHWNASYEGDTDKKAWEADLVDEVKNFMVEDDLTLVYPGWSIFAGTPVDRWLKQRGARTLVLSGYHTDWCIEMAARSARDLGYMPVVVGDACGSTSPLHEDSLAQVNDCYAPVISTDVAIAAIREGRERTKRAMNDA
ncbi:MAG: cysteine hydrolase [Alphaproteobacteria bacterium]|nr:cysteine hydrolase [Alphaproteobacteria bacterium]